MLSTSTLQPPSLVMQRSLTNSDTDDSPFSSNLVTPVDELSQPFDQAAVQDALNDVQGEMDRVSWKPRSVRFRTDHILHPHWTPKHTSLSKGLGMAKTFARALKRSTGSVTPGQKTNANSVRSLVTTAEEVHTVYNMPNKPYAPVSIADLRKSRIRRRAPPTVQGTDDSLAQALDTSSSPIGDASSGGALSTFLESQDSASRERDVATTALIARILLFLPWCIAVGGCIVLLPSQLDLVAFQSGYLSGPAGTGIRRFAYWADSAMQHVFIFLSFVLSFAWWCCGGMRAVAVVALMVAAGLAYAWSDFRVDETIPLGVDDRQTMFKLMVNGLSVREGDIVELGGGKVVVKFDEEIVDYD